MTIANQTLSADSFATRAAHLSDGNPGALTALGQLFVAGCYDTFDWLEQHAVKGPAIWVVFKDFAGCDAVVMHEMVAEQEGQVLKRLRETGYIS